MAKKLEVEKVTRKSGNDERVETLRDLFPEVFTDGRVSVEALREALDGAASDDPPEEHYGLTWPGKQAARRLANRPPQATLRPVHDLSVDAAESENVVVIGDNLQVLLSLRNAYRGEVKFVYIDPPYNTGHDFIYRDDFSEPVDAYLQATNQSDVAGLLVSNPKAGGRFHSKWLSMMLPRLSLARTLLTDDGIIAISIDDNEVHNLRHLMDEVFGAENHLATMIWNKGVSQQQGQFKKYHEYVVVYAKAKDDVMPFASREGGDIIDRALKKISRANPRSEFTFPAGMRVEASDGTEFKGIWGDSETVELVKGKFVVKNGKTTEPITLAAGWTQLNQMRAFYADGRTEPVLDSRGQVVAEFFFSGTGKLKYRKQRSVETPATVQDWGNQSSATDALTRIFEGKTPFDVPKPIGLVKDFIGWVCSEPGDIVLDFFGGSGTTAQAVWESNLETGATRRFILVQLDAQLEETGEAAKDAKKLGATTVADVTIERLRRVSKDLKNQYVDSAKGGGNRILGSRFIAKTNPHWRVRRISQSMKSLAANSLS